MTASLTPAPSRVSANVQGALWMLLTCAFFSPMTAMFRMVTDQLHPVEIVFVRNVFSLLFMLPWIWRAGLGALGTSRFGLLCVRSVLMVVAMVAWVAAVAGLPLADASGIGFTTPLFATAGAAFFLGETVGWRRWSAILLGFVGMLAIVRPGLETAEAASIYALTCAVFVAGATLIMKVLTRTEGATTVVVYLYLLVTPMSAIPAMFFWTTPSLSALGWLAAMGLTASLGHLSLVRAFAVADASAVLPFDFFKLIFAAGFGYALFAERPDI